MEKKQYQQPRMDIYRMMWKETLMNGTKVNDVVSTTGIKMGGSDKDYKGVIRTKERGSIIWGDEDF